MKKLFLILFLLSQIFSSSDIKFQTQIIHGHVHENIQGVKHIHEHSHAEVPLTLYCNLEKYRDFKAIEKEKNFQEKNLFSKLIKNNIFRPPIA